MSCVLPCFSWPFSFSSGCMASSLVNKIESNILMSLWGGLHLSGTIYVSHNAISYPLFQAYAIGPLTVHGDETV